MNNDNLEFGLTTEGSRRLETRLSNIRQRYETSITIPQKRIKQNTTKTSSTSSISFFNRILTTISRLITESFSSRRVYYGPKYPYLTGVKDTIITMNNEDWVLIEHTISKKNTEFNSAVDLLLQQAQDEVTTDIITSMPQVPVHPIV